MKGSNARNACEPSCIMHHTSQTYIAPTSAPDINFWLVYLYCESELLQSGITWTHFYPRRLIAVGIISALAANIMVSEDVFRQRGVTLLYRSFNLMIQCVLYGEFRILVYIFWSSWYTSSGIYGSLIPVSTYIMMWATLLSLWINHFNWPDKCKAEGSSRFGPENPVRRDSFHVFLVNCVSRSLNGGFNHSHQDLVSHSGSFQVSQRDKPYKWPPGSF